ncbi:hypothetical protein LOAG_14334 [Loa loa]|uniref:Uncharacterized protein n=1 Tax=Loa loa TaxID=7209 RepID=A0A1S0THY9_LOALO|nr:hypothetical protein LOAG_14334 [Loa loa]EFO14189.1 hypothetical protein LOAG_14334 [Loa loa]
MVEKLNPNDKIRAENEAGISSLLLFPFEKVLFKFMTRYADDGLSQVEEKQAAKNGQNNSRDGLIANNRGQVIRCKDIERSVGDWCLNGSSSALNRKSEKSSRILEHVEI